jgi:hypothetical protein
MPLKSQFNPPLHHWSFLMSAAIVEKLTGGSRMASHQLVMFMLRNAKTIDEKLDQQRTHLLATSTSAMPPITSPSSVQRYNSNAFQAVHDCDIDAASHTTDDTTVAVADVILSETQVPTSVAANVHVSSTKSRELSQASASSCATSINTGANAHLMEKDCQISELKKTVSSSSIGMQLCKTLRCDVNQIRCEHIIHLYETGLDGLADELLVMAIHSSAFADNHTQDSFSARIQRNNVPMDHHEVEYDTMSQTGSHKKQMLVLPSQHRLKTYLLTSALYLCRSRLGLSLQSMERVSPAKYASMVAMVPSDQWVWLAATQNPFDKFKYQFKRVMNSAWQSHARNQSSLFTDNTLTQSKPTTTPKSTSTSIQARSHVVMRASMHMQINRSFDDRHQKCDHACDQMECTRGNSCHCVANIVPYYHSYSNADICLIRTAIVRQKASEISLRGALNLTIRAKNMLAELAKQVDMVLQSKKQVLDTMRTLELNQHHRVAQRFERVRIFSQPSDSVHIQAGLDDAAQDGIMETSAVDNVHNQDEHERQENTRLELEQEAAADMQMWERQSATYLYSLQYASKLSDMLKVLSQSTAASAHTSMRPRFHQSISPNYT